MMRIAVLTYIFLFLLPLTLSAQERPSGAKVSGAIPTGVEVQGADTTYKYSIAPVRVYANRKDMRQYNRLINNVKKVYPLAKEASEYMHILETEMMQLKTAREREKFTRNMEKEIVKKYTPVLKKMTFSQGKVLIKLIDRETQNTPYAILREFRGKYTAGFWNTIAKIFKADLKDSYDKEGEDAIIEEIILMYEAGLI